MKYQSRYSPDKEITAAQYIIELLCEKKAQFDGYELPLKFWTLPEWKAFFKKNLRKVHSLLKKYDVRAIINALNSPLMKNRYSIFSKYLENIIQQEEKKLVQDTKPSIINRQTVHSKIRSRQPTNNIIDKLNQLDG